MVPIHNVPKTVSFQNLKSTHLTLCRLQFLLIQCIRHSHVICTLVLFLPFIRDVSCLSLFVLGDGTVMYVMFVLFWIGAPHVAFVLSCRDSRLEFAEFGACHGCLAASQPELGLHYTMYMCVCVTELSCECDGWCLKPVMFPLCWLFVVQWNLSCWYYCIAHIMAFTSLIELHSTVEGDFQNQFLLFFVV